MSTNLLTALITGGTSAIGQAPAKELAQLHIHVIVVSRDPARGETTVAEIRGAGGKADFISSDLQDASIARPSTQGTCVGLTAGWSARRVSVESNDVHAHRS